MEMGGEILQKSAIGPPPIYHSVPKSTMVNVKI